MVALVFGQHKIIGFLVPAMRAPQLRLERDDHPIAAIAARQFPAIQIASVLAPEAPGAKLVPLWNVLEGDGVLVAVYVHVDARHRRRIHQNVGDL